MDIFSLYSNKRPTNILSNSDGVDLQLDGSRAMMLMVVWWSDVELNEGVEDVSKFGHLIHLL